LRVEKLSGQRRNLVAGGEAVYLQTHAL
jgi:hypothetical protein